MTHLRHCLTYQKHSSQFLAGGGSDIRKLSYFIILGLRPLFRNLGRVAMVLNSRYFCIYCTVYLDTENCLASALRLILELQAFTIHCFKPSNKYSFFKMLLITNLNSTISNVHYSKVLLKHLQILQIYPDRLPCHNRI